MSSKRDDVQGWSADSPMLMVPGDSQEAPRPVRSFLMFAIFCTSLLANGYFAWDYFNGPRMQNELTSARAELNSLRQELALLRQRSQETAIARP